MLASGILRPAYLQTRSATGWHARYHCCWRIEDGFDRSLPTLDPAVNCCSASAVRSPRPEAHDDMHLHLAFLSLAVLAECTRLDRQSDERRHPPRDQDWPSVGLDGLSSGSIDYEEPAGSGRSAQSSLDCVSGTRRDGTSPRNRSHWDRTRQGMSRLAGNWFLGKAPLTS